MIALAGPFMRILDKLSHQYVNKVFVHSNFVKSDVQRIYGRDVDVEIVHDGVDPVFFRKTFSLLDDEYRDREVLLHIASYLNPMKGTKYAIEAMQTVVQQIPNALLVILNFNNDVAEQKKLRDLACLLGIEDNIIFVVGVGDIDVVRYYSLSKVLLQPSLDENVHLPPLEAAACECPSVVFDGLFSSEEVIDRETGYIVPRYQSSAMGIAAIDLIRHSVLRNDFGVKSREYVMKNFSWDQCVLKYIERIK
jgi:glycosyltransferase involved in cell wall biosynthesis